MDKPKYAFFWGCQIPARLAFMEKSTRAVLRELGISFVDLAGFTCCPEKALVKNLTETGWLLAAARNLAVAEAAGLDILTACNGCYSTLRSVANELAESPDLMAGINARLATVGLSYRARVKVKHLLEVLHDEVGPGKIRSLVQKPMVGLKIAVHYGCHMLRPSSAVHFDDPLKPTKYDLVVEALGATSLDHYTKMLCCGGGLAHIGDNDNAMALTRKKLMEVQGKGADALTTFCPACYLQYEHKQFLAQKQGEKLNVPVFTYPELLGLAMGLSAEDLGLDQHRVDTTAFFQSWEKHRRDFEIVRKHLDLAAVRACYSCGACVSDCPVAETTSSFQPNQLIGLVLDGRVDELLRAGDFWKCLECHTCYEMCPQKFGMERVFSVLKHLAISRGLMPPSVKGGVDLFLKTGRLAAADEKARHKLGLEDLPGGGEEQLRQLLADLDLPFH